jgi:hypothetical protein
MSNWRASLACSYSDIGGGGGGGGGGKEEDMGAQVYSPKTVAADSIGSNSRCTARFFGAVMPPPKRPCPLAWMLAKQQVSTLVQRPEPSKHRQHVFGLARS